MCVTKIKKYWRGGVQLYFFLGGGDGGCFQPLYSPLLTSSLQPLSCLQTSTLAELILRTKKVNSTSFKSVRKRVCANDSLNMYKCRVDFFVLQKHLEMVVKQFLFHSAVVQCCMRVLRAFDTTFYNSIMFLCSATCCYRLQSLNFRNSEHR